MLNREKRQRSRLLWIWVLFIIGLIVWLSYSMFEAKDKTIFMPGPLTAGHHQIGLVCSACHKDPLSDGEVFQKACTNCHGDDRKKPFDSHPRTKFTDPRNADTLENINAQQCISCHTEHQPDMTNANGLTQPVDFCVHCHSDIGDDRPSHKGMEFNTCNSSGCHNFHNNRSLYTDFLVKHLNEPDLLSKQLLPEREFSKILEELTDYPVDRYPFKQLSDKDADATENHQLETREFKSWLDTAHAGSGVNCSACHESKQPGAERVTWADKPDHTACARCHNLEVERFKRGKHGMRLAVDLPPMKVIDARQPMKKEAGHKQLDCNSCHSAHRFDVSEAAVESCLGCHDDKHSLAYKESPHYTLWQKEISGDALAGSGVSCASCHMPRINYDVSEWMSRTMVDHNQNANLSPNEKMIRSSCIHCHGLGFTLNALADKKLIDNNFNGKPSVEVESMSLAEEDHKRAQQELLEIQDN